MKHLHIVARATVYSNKTWEVMANTPYEAIEFISALYGYAPDQLFAYCGVHEGRTYGKS